MDTYRQPTELDIVDFVENGDYHICRDYAGKKINIDLLTDGSIEIPGGISYLAFCRSIVGKKVKVQYSHTFLHMASEPEII